MFVLPAVAFFGGLVVLGAALTVRQDMARMAAQAAAPVQAA
jgi:hypothetical protein